MKIKNYPIGSVSSGTMRTEDLIPDFVDELEHLSAVHRVRGNQRFINRVNREIDRDEDGSYFDNERADWDLDELFDKLGEFAGPYCYFGSRMGDGADFGFWLDEDALRDFDGLKVADLSEVPRGFSGEVLNINDHGNVSLYHVTMAGKFREIWAIV